MEPVLIAIIIVIILLIVFIIKKMIKIGLVLGIIFIILLIMYPRECGYHLDNEIKECGCTGFLREGERFNLCYGFCKNDCLCQEVNITSGNITEVECGNII